MVELGGPRRSRRLSRARPRWAGAGAPRSWTRSCAPGARGAIPACVERRRLLLGGSAGALRRRRRHVRAAGWACAGRRRAVGVARLLRARRRRYRAAVDAGVAELAVAIADAIGGGRSLRAALGRGGGRAWEARRGTSCAAPRPSSLRAPPPTTRSRPCARRVRSPRMDALVAACLLQRRAGGDLAGLLRESARAMEDQARLEDEVRSATAQARFTALIVVLLPLGGALLAELASPGWFAGLWSSFLTAWLVGIALVLQLVAAVLMRRLGRVRW